MPQHNYSGEYKIAKRNRNDEENVRSKRDQPWTKSILNMEENKVLGHTPSGWLRLVLFYIIFALILTLFVVAYFYLFLKFCLPKNKPMYDHGQPGLSSAPRPDKTKKIEYFEDVMQEIRPYFEQIESFLELKEESDNSRFHDCNSDSIYGYRTRQPCVFVKLNRALNFQFEPYENHGALPKHAPPNLISFMKTLEVKRGANDGEFDKRIWLSCENGNGREEPEFQYIPQPYWDIDDLLWDKPTESENETESKPNEAPDVHKRIIAVKLLNTPTDNDVAILCTVWARNMKIDCSVPGAGWIAFNLKIKEKV